MGISTRDVYSIHRTSDDAVVWYEHTKRDAYKWIEARKHNEFVHYYVTDTKGTVV